MSFEVGWFDRLVWCDWPIDVIGGQRFCVPVGVLRYCTCSGGWMGGWMGGCVVRRDNHQFCGQTRLPLRARHCAIKSTRSWRGGTCA